MTNYIIDDLRRTMVRIAANERWYELDWLGVPIWQLPDDLINLQNIIFQVKPTWIIETGTKFGGSAIFFASLLELLGLKSGGVLTTDIHLLPEARHVFKNHRLGHLVRTSIEGDAASQETVNKMTDLISETPGTVLVFLDDNHNAEHVYKEMGLYAPLVSIDSYLIVADTSFADLAGTPIGEPNDKYPDVAASNPRVAIEKFLLERGDFFQDKQFAGKGLSNFGDGFLKRLK